MADWWLPGRKRQRAHLATTSPAQYAGTFHVGIPVPDNVGGDKSIPERSAAFPRRRHRMKTRRLTKTQLRVEELEGRLVLSAVITTTSNNWSGYAVVAKAG